MFFIYLSMINIFVNYLVELFDILQISCYYFRDFDLVLRFIRKHDISSPMIDFSQVIR
jgi:hypothetical protein